jgi:hypothetical protein
MLPQVPNRHDLMRLREDAADELARLDQTCLLDLPAVGAACWHATIAAVHPDPSVLDLLVAAAADPVHDATLGEDLIRLRDFAASEERRLRTGTPLSVKRWETLAPGLATYAGRDLLEAEWSDGTTGRSVLDLAVATAAWFDDDTITGNGQDVAALAAALLLCATGRTAHLRVAPFAALSRARRREAAGRWREGAPEEWATLAVEAIIASARRRRDALSGLAAARARDDERIATLGRAGINARRTLSHLHGTLASTMPIVAEALDLSRPAAAAALDRLVELGVARELTGRARDRVFAWAAPLAAVAAPPAT